MAATDVSRELALAARPVGPIDEACFRLRETSLPVLAAGDVLVDNLAMSVDPYMYLRALGDEEQARGAYGIGETPDAFAVGRVRESLSSAFRVGDMVTSFLGWRDCFVAQDSMLNPLPDGFDLPPEAHLSVLGVSSFTAWLGMTQFVEPQAGQNIFISGAAGGVGLLATQMALKAGLAVVASAGTRAKCDWLAGLGNVATINYRETPDLAAALHDAVPDGLDLYFDNVGGRHLEAAISQAKPRAHFIGCGTMASFLPNDDPASWMTDIRLLPAKAITLHSYTASLFFHLHGDFIDFMRDWQREGGPVVPRTEFEGLESAPRALRSLFGGGNLGKTIVKIR